MNLGKRLCAYALAAAVSAATIPSITPAQERDSSRHVVTLDELKQQSGAPAQARAENEAAVRHLLSSEVGRDALKSANLDYERVDKAVGQLSDQDLARLADRSRQAESDFAAGFISPKTLAYIILATVVIVVVIVLV